MATRGGVLFPLALMGAGLLVMGGGASSASAVMSGPTFTAVLGTRSNPRPVPVRIEAHEVVALFSEHRGGDWHGHARVLLARDSGQIESFHLLETPDQVAEKLGLHGFLKLHLPTGTTRARTREQWRDSLEDEPSMELVPLWLNPESIEAIEPSPTTGLRRGRLGRVYVHGACFDLYESMSRLRKMVPRGTPEWAGEERRG